MLWFIMVSLLFNQRTLSFALAYALFVAQVNRKNKSRKYNKHRVSYNFMSEEKKINKLLSSKMFQNENVKKTTPKNIYCVSGLKHTFFRNLTEEKNNQTSVKYCRWSAFAHIYICSNDAELWFYTETKETRTDPIWWDKTLEYAACDEAPFDSFVDNIFMHFAVGSIFNRTLFIFLHFLLVFAGIRQVAIDEIDDLIIAHINFSSFQLTTHHHFHPCIVSNYRIALSFFTLYFSSALGHSSGSFNSDWCSDNIVCIHSSYERKWIQREFNDILIFPINV